MDSRIIGMITEIISFCNNSFINVLTAAGGFGFWFSAILVTISFKFFLRPIFGQAGSDIAKKSYNAFKKKIGKDDN